MTRNDQQRGHSKNAPGAPEKRASAGGMNKGKIAVIAIVAVGIAAAATWTHRGGEAPATEAAAGKGVMVTVTLPATLSEAAKMGEKAFNAVCAACHGANAAGTEAGPPLVHEIYEPSHHGDHAFEMAVVNGVRAHHWTFGDMPAQPAMTRADLRNVIAYVREMQRANGID
ncbi:c-type cytochrome [Shinella granuli]|uniref:Cytochrome c n=1 Tax=Shinella granuli TaxID=323621 RepID=A0A4R2CWX5_SHIGR|nr:cytochrome c [Shinella granuli]TCN46157.1 cytochrome c [Shinella granuli]